MNFYFAPATARGHHGQNLPARVAPLKTFNEREVKMDLRRI
jgi:hypothetical protein